MILIFGMKDSLHQELLSVILFPQRGRMDTRKRYRTYKEGMKLENSIDILAISQYRSGTAYFKHMINRNSNINMHNINLEFLKRNITLPDWMRMKKTRNFLLTVDALLTVPPKLALTAKTYIYFIRKDVVAHAISKIIAAEIGIRKEQEIKEPLRTQRLKKLIETPEKNIEKVYTICVKILAEHALIEKFLQRHHIKPYRCYYEDFCQFPEKTTAEVLRHLGVNVSGLEIKPSILEAQTTPYHKKLIDLYKNSEYYQQDIIHKLFNNDIFI